MGFPPSSCARKHPGAVGHPPAVHKGTQEQWCKRSPVLGRPQEVLGSRVGEEMQGEEKVVDDFPEEAAKHSPWPMLLRMPSCQTHMPLHTLRKEK